MWRKRASTALAGGGVPLIPDSSIARGDWATQRLEGREWLRSAPAKGRFWRLVRGYRRAVRRLLGPCFRRAALRWADALLGLGIRHARQRGAVDIGHALAHVRRLDAKPPRQAVVVAGAVDDDKIPPIAARKDVSAILKRRLEALPVVGLLPKCSIPP